MLGFLRWFFLPEVAAVGAIFLLGTGYAMGLAPAQRNIKLAHVFFGAGAFWFYGAALEWLMNSGELPMPKPLIAFLVCGFIGASWMWAYGWVETNHKEAGTISQVTEALQSPAPTKKPDISQESKGANSPNIVGDNNTVTINSTPPSPSFHEKTDAEMFNFAFGEHGMFTSQSIGWIRKHTYQPFLFGGYAPVTVTMKGDKLLFNFKVWGGEGKPPIEVKNNDFTVRVPMGWDRNSSANALEVVNANGAPVFQMIRKNATDIVVSGVFPTPSGFLLAGPEGAITGAKPEQISNFHLKPLFKYPSWKYPGQYAD